MFAIYHNPACSKSRAALRLLQEHGVEPEVILYLETPPTAEELTGLIAKLQVEPKAILRRSEAEATTMSAERLNDRELIQLMVTYPILIERPIIIRDDRAVIGRPPERVLTLL